MFKKLPDFRRIDTWSHFSYIFRYCIPTGFSGIKHSFIYWIKLLQGDYSDYKILNSRKQIYTDEELFEQLREDFWYSLEDDVMDKETVELICQRMKEVDEGKVKLIPLTEDFFDDLKDLIDFK